MAKAKSVTLQQFYQEFVKFANREEHRWEGNDKKWEANGKRIDGLDLRMEGFSERFDGLDKRMERFEKELRKTNKRFDELFNFLDREIMADRKRLDRLEAKAGIITPS